jgi:hypothetical protein
VKNELDPEDAGLQHRYALQGFGQIKAPAMCVNHLRDETMFGQV